ncbi:hypothetical protein DFS33DRAFT_1278356 [Desarmillaria ectypa]|nr:hypothetical protein DFS33DRAFT_1278356 [Desarmillaria ectypa]
MPVSPSFPSEVVEIIISEFWYFEDPSDDRIAFMTPLEGCYIHLELKHLPGPHYSPWKVLNRPIRTRVSTRLDEAKTRLTDPSGSENSLAYYFSELSRNINQYSWLHKVRRAPAVPVVFTAPYTAKNEGRIWGINHRFWKAGRTPTIGESSGSSESTMDIQGVSNVTAEIRDIQSVTSEAFPIQKPPASMQFTPHFATSASRRLWNCYTPLSSITICFGWIGSLLCQGVNENLDGDADWLVRAQHLTERILAAKISLMYPILSAPYFCLYTTVTVNDDDRPETDPRQARPGSQLSGKYRIRQQ